MPQRNYHQNHSPKPESVMKADASLVSFLQLLLCSFVFFKFWPSAYIHSRTCCLPQFASFLPSSELLPMQQSQLQLKSIDCSWLLHLLKFHAQLEEATIDHAINCRQVHVGQKHVTRCCEFPFILSFTLSFRTFIVDPLALVCFPVTPSTPYCHLQE